MTMQKVVPCLWFDKNAEEAAKFYVSLFDNASIREITRYNNASSKASGMPVGSVMTVTFEIDGQEFMGLNGGPIFKFNEAVSFIIKCPDQAEVDRLWNALIKNGGEESVCGWLKDKYGLSWQIVPDQLELLLLDPDKEKVEAVTAALMEMKKIDIGKLVAASISPKVMAHHR